MIRVLIAEDQGLVRGALTALLGLEGDIEVVAETGRGDEVVLRALEVSPDVALLDIEMPGLDGLAAAAQLRRALPACRVLMLTTFGRPGYLRRAMDAGASGFLLKDAPATELASAIRRAAAGGRVVDPALALEALSEGSNPLSEREREMLTATIDAATIADIAKRLSLSEGTVRNHLSAAIQKVGARNRAEAARIALEKGWIGPMRGGLTRAADSGPGDRADVRVGAHVAFFNHAQRVRRGGRRRGSTATCGGVARSSPCRRGRWPPLPPRGPSRPYPSAGRVLGRGTRRTSVLLGQLRRRDIRRATAQWQRAARGDGSAGDRLLR